MLTATRRTGVLSTNADGPPVPQTAVGADLLQALNVITKLGSNVLRKDLRVFSSLEVLLSVQKPQRDLELTRILNDGHKLLNFIGCELSGALVDVDFGFFADQIGEPTTDATDLCKTKDNVTLALNVGIENTQNVLEFGSLHQRRRPA
jgi:hypothetical protein